MIIRATLWAFAILAASSQALSPEFMALSGAVAYHLLFCGREALTLEQAEEAAYFRVVDTLIHRDVNKAIIFIPITDAGPDGQAWRITSELVESCKEPE